MPSPPPCPPHSRHTPPSPVSKGILWHELWKKNERKQQPRGRGREGQEWTWTELWQLMAVTLGSVGGWLLELKQDYFSREKTNGVLGNTVKWHPGDQDGYSERISTVTTFLFKLQHQEISYQHLVQNKSITCARLFVMADVSPCCGKTDVSGLSDHLLTPLFLHPMSKPNTEKRTRRMIFQT